jgi:hypothetical protein
MGTASERTSTTSSLLPADRAPSLSHPHIRHALDRSSVPISHGHDRPSFPLLGIFFAEFDNTVGPKITCQSPEGFLSDEFFEAISDFMITGPELCHKLVTVAAFDYTIIGYPMSLSHKKYHRNALLFNIAFVFPRDVHAHSNAMEWQEQQQQQQQQGNLNKSGASALPPSSFTSYSGGLPIAAASQATVTQLRPYHAVIRKLATIIESLEVESEFLFRPESKKLLQGLVSDIFKKLNAYGECSVPLREEITNSINATNPNAAANTASNTAAAHSKSATATASSASSASINLLTPGGSDSPLISPSLSSASAAVSSSLHPPLGNGNSLTSGADVHEIRLKLYPLLALPPRHIPSFLVPIPVKDLEARWKREWDLTLRQVIPFMDGTNYVSKIALLSGIHISLVTKCVRQLLYYEAIQLIDIFQFSNRYMPTDALTKLCSTINVTSEDEKNRALKLRRDARIISRLDPKKPKPPFHLLFRLLTALGPNVTLGDTLKNMHLLIPTIPTSTDSTSNVTTSSSPSLTFESGNIHPRKFIQFALINGLIRRVYLYPVLVSQYLSGSSGGVSGVGISSSSSSTHLIHQQGSPNLSGLNGMPINSPPTSERTSGVTSSRDQPTSSPNVSLSGMISSNVDLSFLGLFPGRQSNLIEESLQKHLAGQQQRLRTVQGQEAIGAQAQQQWLHIQQSNAKGMFSGGTIPGASIVNASLPTNPAGLKRDASNSHKQVSGDVNVISSSTVNESNVSLGVPPSLMSHTSSGGGGGIHPPSSSPPPLHTAPLSFRALERYLDGEHHFDELCCMFGRSFIQMEEEIKKNKKCVIIAK